MCVIMAECTRVKEKKKDKNKNKNRKYCKILHYFVIVIMAGPFPFEKNVSLQEKL